MLSKIHQAIFRRQQSTHRNPVFIYLDEFQHFITPSIQDMLSGVRKYQVGLILSHQDLQQLQRENNELLNSVLSNSYMRIVFRVGEPDAKRLQDGFSGFDHTDLQSLGRGEAIMRVEQPAFDCSLDTIPLSVVTEDEKVFKKEIVVTHSREKHSTSKDEVETILSEMFAQKEATEPRKTTQSKQQATQTPEEHTKPESIQPIKQEEIIVVKEDLIEPEKDKSNHRYLQTLVKKMAEERGYIATLEKQLPAGNGLVDVLLVKDGKSIAVELCITTNPEWESHNIAKCLDANYDMVISLSGDPKQLEKIRKKCVQNIPNFSDAPVHFCTPDMLFTFLNTTIKQEASQEQSIKGYRVNVSYESMSQEEMEKKRKSVSKVIFDSLKKRQKK